MERRQQLDRGCGVAARPVRRRQQAGAHRPRKGGAGKSGGDARCLSRRNPAGSAQGLLRIRRRAPASRGRSRRDRAGGREPAHQPEPLRRRPEHGQRSAARGRSRPSRQGRLLAGGVPRANQLCRGGTGDWDTYSRFSGGDAMMNDRLAGQQLVNFEDGRILGRAGLQSVCKNYAWCATGEQPAAKPAPQARLSLAQHGAAGGVLGGEENGTESRRDGTRETSVFGRVPHPFALLWRKGGRATVSALALLLGLTACSGEKPTTAPTPEVVRRDVTLFTAQHSTVPDQVEATGTVRAAQSAQLSSQVMGAITRVNVHEGDRVRRGEVLIMIEAAQQRSAYDSANAGLTASRQTIAAADADYALAEATMKRYQMLYDKKSVSPQEYDEVKARLAAAKARRDGAHAGRVQAEAAVSEANTAVGFTRIRAPFDGLIVAKLADAGAMAAPGVPLLIVEDPSRFRLEAQVDESQIGAVRLS